MKKLIFCFSIAVTLNLQFVLAQCITGNCIDGSGVMYYPSSSSRYVGEFKGGKREGFGYLYLPNDGNYTGYWKNNRYDGEGIRLTGDGKVEQGIWKEGQPSTNAQKQTFFFDFSAHQIISHKNHNPERHPSQKQIPD